MVFNKLGGIKFSVFLFIAFAHLSYVFDLHDMPFVSFVFVSLSSLMLLILIEDRNIFHFSWVMSFFVFIFTPFMVSYNFLDQSGFEVILVSQFLTLLFIHLTRGFVFVKPEKPLNGFKYLRFLVPISGVAAAWLLPYGSFGFILYSGIYLVFIIYSTYLPLRVFLYQVLLPYFLYFLIFYFFIWGGFGRLLLAGGVFVPILIFLYAYRLNVSSAILIFFASFLSFLMNSLRFGGQISIDTYINDSSFSPFALANELYHSFEFFSLDVSGYIGQLVLVFFGFVPRELWFDKSIGFGRLFVEQEMGAGYSEGHSIAGLFLGESFYFLSDMWWLGAVLSVFVIYFLIKELYKMRGLLSYSSFMVAIYLPSFIWGGYASFGQRFSVAFIPVLLLVLFMIMKRQLSRIV